MVKDKAAADALLEQYRAETRNDGERRFAFESKPADFPAGRAVLQSSPQAQAWILGEILRDEDSDKDAPRRVLGELLSGRKLPLTALDVERLVQKAVVSKSWRLSLAPALKQAKFFTEAGGRLTPALESGFRELQSRLLGFDTPDNRKTAAQIGELLGADTKIGPEPGDPWADRAISGLAALPPERRAKWDALLGHAATADGAKPGAKWQAEAARLREAVGGADYDKTLAEWLGLVALPAAFDRPAPAVNVTPDFAAVSLEYNTALKKFQQHQESVARRNQPLLQGLIWGAARSAAPEIARGLAHTAQLGFTPVTTQAAFSQFAERGAFSEKLGNAAIWALGQMPGGAGVGTLSLLRTRLRDRGALKRIAGAIESAAAASGISADALEDLAVPTGGLGADGVRTEIFGAEGSARLSLDPATGRTRLEWFGADGTPRKAVPAGVKKEFAAEAKALKDAEDAVQAAVTAQAARLDAALLGGRTWTLGAWREQYGRHPILGNLARRLLWTVGGAAALPDGEGFADVSGKALTEPADDGEMTLWHPLSAPPADVLRWRDALEGRGLTQPFKQAHREVYLLTDAERATRTYSNRFAAHVLKQHQFNSLCIARGWKNTLRLMVDDWYPPATRPLPQFGLRAEFWIEGDGQDYRTDANDSGTLLRVLTDQVRFYALDAPANYAHASGGGYSAERGRTPAEPVPLADVPPLALSEIFRDADLFVGVASIGSDPDWADGGPEGRFRDYWKDYAFGELTETAKTRAAVLARLLPRLRIAERCTLDGRFLVVRGDRHTYKIHLGSGNVLREPNAQFLCIVPARAADPAADVFLPFEGDRVLAIILSKAFLLADDTKITDPAIESQIRF